MLAEDQRDEGTARLHALRAKWLARTTTERERAALEQQAWEVTFVYPATRGQSSGRRTFLRDLFGCAGDLIEARNLLREGGADAEPLWDMVEQKKLLLRTSMRLWRSARTRAATNRIPRGDALAQVLDEYQQLSPVQSSTGVLVRKRKSAQLPRLDGAGESVVAPLRVDPMTTVPTLWRQIRLCAAEVVRRHLPDGVDPTVQQQLVADFEGELAGVLDTLRARINTVRQTERAFNQVRRQQVLDACVALNLDPPSPGKPVDARMLRRQRRELCRLYHPDRNMGQSTRPQYESVIAANALLERYNQQLGRGAVVSVIEGGAGGASNTNKPALSPEEQE